MNANPQWDRKMETLADALNRFQVRFSALHQHSIWKRLDPDVYNRGRRLMVWIGDRCNIPYFEDVLVTPNIRRMIDELPMSDYAIAVEHGEVLIRAIEEEAGYGHKRSEIHDLGLDDAVKGREYNRTYLPDIDVSGQQVRYPAGGFEYYQGYRSGLSKLAAHSSKMKQIRIIPQTRRST